MIQLDNTSPAEMDRLFDRQKSYFNSGHTRSLDVRLKQLKRLKKALKAYEPALFEAFRADFPKPDFETYASEIGFVYAELSDAIRNLPEWSRKRKVSSPLSTWPSRSYIQPEPKGVTLIIAPWNYPLNLILAPLVAAMAAGNTAILKPAEQSPAVARCVQDMVEEYFEAEYLSVVQGEGAEVIPHLMKEHRFDHVFFTGSTEVGRKIALMAAEQLTPVTLELGGKSPAIVDASANLKVAARRIAFGKWLNAGQTCVAPDYLLVHRSVATAFQKELKAAVERFYPKGALASDDYTAMIHRDHFEKVSGYLNAKQIVWGGETDADRLIIAPTLLSEVSEKDPVMQEEIFGPVLPMLTYQKSQEALEIIRKRSRPLALYVFAQDRSIQKTFTTELSFGGGAINNTVVHLANPALPFGGIGDSGQGNYHGQYGFETFSHLKSIMKTGTWLDPALKYPPYGPFIQKAIRWLMR